MTKSSIIIFAVIYAGALIFTLIKKNMPKTFTLLGVEYGKDFKDFTGKGKIVYTFVSIVEVLFIATHFILPPITALFWNWPRMNRWFLFLVVYVVTVVIWLLVYAADGHAKARYSEDREKILHDSPMYNGILERLRNDQNIQVVAPLRDGIAFFYQELPKVNVSQEVAFDGDVVLEAKRWESRIQNVYSSVHSCGCNFALLSADFGVNKLSREDRKDICLFLSKEEDLGIKNKTYTATCNCYIDYTVITKKEYEWYSTTKSKDKRISESAEFELPIAVRKPK